MKNRKHSLLIKLVSLLLAASCIVSGTAYAAVPETVQPLDSEYIYIGRAYLSPMGSGRLQIHFSVNATGTMEELGASSIVVYESSDQVSWNKQKTYNGEEYVAMLTENAHSHSGYVTFLGVAGRYYKAYVSIYASKNGGSDTRSFWTPVVQAT